MDRQLVHQQTAGEIEVVIASTPPTTVGTREHLPKRLVLTRNDSEAERLLLIRKLQEGYSKSPLLIHQGDDDTSMQSARSTKSWWRRGRSNHIDDDAVKTKSVFTGKQLWSSRRKNKKNSSRKFFYSQSMANSLDVQSVASQPNLVGSQRLTLFSWQESHLFNDRDAASISSSRSIQSFFLSFRKGAEAHDLEDGDITMTSGLTPTTSATGEIYSIHSRIHLDPPEGAMLAPPKLDRKPSMLGRLVRNRRKACKTRHPADFSLNRLAKAHPKTSFWPTRTKTMTATTM